MPYRIIYDNGVGELWQAEYGKEDEALTQANWDAQRAGGAILLHVLDPENVIIKAWRPLPTEGDSDGIQRALTSTELATYAQAVVDGTKPLAPEGSE